MMPQAFPQGDRRSLIEDHAHSDRSQSTPGGVLEDRARSLDSDTRKPFNKFCNRGAAFEILEQGGHRHARAAKNPCAAHFGWVALNGRTRRPIDHDAIVTSARDGSYWRASVQYAVNFGMDEKRILDEEYLRAIELVEALPENQSGADKTWVPLHAGGIR